MPEETDLDSQARNRLIAVVRASGGSLIDDPDQLFQQLSSFGSFDTEYTLFMKALEYRIPQDLVAAPPGPVNRIADFLTRRFSGDAHIPFSQAKWVVDSWALALDKEISPTDTLGGIAGGSFAGPSAASLAPQTPQTPLAGPPPAQPSWQQSPPAGPGWQQQPPAQPGWQQQPPGVWPPPAYDPMSPMYAGDNTSGTLGPIPPAAEVHKWSWGAAGVSWIWLVSHNMVGWGIAVLALNYCIPCFGLAAFIYLGINGNRLAWQNRRYESIEHFKAVERVWGSWGIALFIIGVVIGIIYGIAIVFMGVVRPTHT